MNYDSPEDLCAATALIVDDNLGEAVLLAARLKRAFNSGAVCVISGYPLETPPQLKNGVVDVVVVMKDGEEAAGFARSLVESGVKAVIMIGDGHTAGASAPVADKLFHLAKKDALEGGLERIIGAMPWLNGRGGGAHGGRRAESAAENHSLMNTLNRALSLYIRKKEPCVVFSELLDAILSFTSSEFGFIGEYCGDPEKPFLIMHAISDITANDAESGIQRRKYKSNVVFDKMDNLIGEAIKTRSAVISNNLLSDPRSKGIFPPGHPQIRSFMGAPLVMGEEVVGIAAVANRPQGYDDDIAANLKPITSVCVHIIEDYRNFKRREESEKEIIRAKEKAEEATKLKDKFISLVAHDIRSPFVSMLGLMNLVKSGEMGPLNENQAGALMRAVDAGENLLRMVDDLLNINRLQTGRITVCPRFMDASIVAGTTIARLEHLAARKGVRLVNEVQVGSRIYADPALFDEVILNFVTNAIKFTRAGGEVSIFMPKDRTTTVSVKDTGIGLNPDILPNLFRCEVPTSTRGTNGERGTGLGLPLAHEIMMAHGGDITVESQPGNGSVFSANLPFVKPLVLIVEDDPDERYLYRNRLASMDVNIIEAADGLEGLSIAIRQQPHLVIADIHMPVMDGIEMTRRLKLNPKTKMIPLMVMTSSSSIEKREEVLRLGADDFATKPIVENEFVPRIRRFIC